MFSNLSKGSVLYGLETKGGIKFFTAPIESVSFPRPKGINTTFGQLPEMVVDIVANEFWISFFFFSKLDNILSNLCEFSLI